MGIYLGNFYENVCNDWCASLTGMPSEKCNCTNRLKWICVNCNRRFKSKGNLIIHQKNNRYREGNILGIVLRKSLRKIKKIV